MATTSIATEVQCRLHPRARTLRRDFINAGLRVLDELHALTWPSPKYREDPVGFGRDVLGVEAWEKQVEVLEAARDHKRVAVAAGHKVSKSHTLAWIALWFYCSFDDARVVLTSTTSRQVDQILWRELRMMVARAGRCVDCKREAPDGPRPCPHSALIDGRLGELARTGLKCLDFREVVGFTAREAEAVAGISGKNLLYLPDEASGIDDAIFEAIEGNRAGGARLVMFSNPTRADGEFFAAFHEKSEFYKTLSISSEDSPNVREGREVIPGLATREWVEEKKREWGEESPLYRIRVKGEFVLNETGRIISVDLVTKAEARWKNFVDADGNFASSPADGRLHLGVDVAGPGGLGDESTFVPRRGVKVLRVIAKRGLSADSHVAHIVGILKEHRSPTEPPPIVKVDREGPIGSEIYGLLRAHAELYPNDFEVYGVRASDRARRAPLDYDRVRDELWANLALWLIADGAIPEDVKLSKELTQPEWVFQVTSRAKVTPKDDLKKALGRSPDRADGLALAVWEPSNLDAAPVGEAQRAADLYEPPTDINAYTLDGLGSSDPVYG